MNDQALVEALRLETNDPTGVLPAGEYVLGDPCYSLTTPAWQRIQECLGEVEDAEVVFYLPDGTSATAFFFSPHLGDGVYEVRGREEGLPVDSGLLAMIPLVLLQVFGTSLQHYVDVTYFVHSESELEYAEDDDAYVFKADEDYIVSLDY